MTTNSRRRIAVLTAMVTLTALAGGALAGLEDSGRKWFGPFDGVADFEFDHNVEYVWKQELDDDAGFDPNDELGWVDQAFRVTIPVHADDRQELFVGARIANRDVRVDGVSLPDTGEDFPECLWDITFNALYRMQLDNGWTVGVQGEVGSASDEPFHSIDEMIFTVNGFMRMPLNQQWAIMVYLNWTTQREFLRYIPIPGIAVEYAPDETFQLVVGAPFSSIRWMPTPQLVLEGQYLMMRTVRARATYHFIDDVSVYVGYEWGHDSWHRADAPEADDWLFSYEQRVLAGARWDITENVYIDAYGAYIFERFWFEGEDYDEREFNRLDLDEGALLGVNLGVRF